MVFCSTLGALVSFFIGIFNPRVVNKAGPDWLWMGGREDVIRSLYFKPNGAFRRYGLLALMLTLAAASLALFWLGARF